MTHGHEIIYSHCAEAHFCIYMQMKGKTMTLLTLPTSPHHHSAYQFLSPCTMWVGNGPSITKYSFLTSSPSQLSLAVVH